MNRQFWMGLGIFALSMGVSYAGFTAASPGRKLVVQRRAVPAPAAPVPAPPPARETRAAAPAAPAPVPEYVAEPEPVAPSPLPEDYRSAEPYNPAADPRRPLVDPNDYLRKAAPSRSRAASAATIPPPEPEAPVRPEGFCMVCGAPTDNWVEVDGRKQGYCPKHLSRVKIPVPPSAPAQPAYVPPAPAASAPAYSQPAESPGDSGTSVQCRGVTKSGTPCRRKTRDPSGLCYQHRGQQ